MRARFLRLLPLLLSAACANAHVGSPDIYFDGDAGPYKVFATIRAPQVIPGVAEIELRIPGQGRREVRLTPMPLSGPGARFAPAADLAQVSPADPNLYTGTLWMMSSGSWQVKIQVDGSRGNGELRIPVPAVARRTAEMDETLGRILLGLMAFLAIGAVAIFGAAAREGNLPPGAGAPPRNRRRGWAVMAAAALAVAAALWGGSEWWKAEAAAYSRIVFKPLALKTSVSGSQLILDLEHTGWMQSKTFDDLVPDHGHWMHLFVVAESQDRIWHLHPSPQLSGGPSGRFVQTLPRLPAGRYRLYGDIVHRSGLPETLVAELELADVNGAPLTGDDSESHLSPGLTMVMDTPSTLPAKKLHVLQFRLLDENNQPAAGRELYLGMPAHAAVLRRDGNVFAHLHPSGTVPAAALAMAAPANPHAGHSTADALPDEVTFPYGFPEPGDYRIFVQMKRNGAIETGSFDVRVTN